MSKDTIKVNMNIYDIPIIVEQLKKLEQENKQLKDLLNKANDEVVSYCNCCIDLQERIDKAIDYIKRNSYGWEVKYFQDDAEASELLEILGEENEKEK